MNFGERLRQIRTEKGLKQIDLAKHLNVAQSTLSGWETGNFEIDNENLKKLADLFGCSIDYILCRSNNINGVSDEMEDILETIRRRPEMKALFSLSKKATKEDVEKTLKIIEALKGG